MTTKNKSIKDTKKTVGDTKSPIGDTAKSIEDTAKSIEDTAKSIEDTAKSIEDTEKDILTAHLNSLEIETQRNLVSSIEIQKLLHIVQDFIKKKHLVCYGGFAINELLPENDKIYNKEIHLPDYDFFSSNALNHAKELADLFFKKGYTNVEAKTTVHHGTYKVFVNYIPIADITGIEKSLFKIIQKKAINVNGLLVTDPVFLKMAMYLELSRPEGQIDRWPKVLDRLNLINKYYPYPEEVCGKITYDEDKKNKDIIYETLKTAFIDKNVVFLGQYANSHYSKYIKDKKNKNVFEKIADYDVLAENALEVAEYAISKLKQYGNVKIKKREKYGEIIPEGYEIILNNDILAIIYTPLTCYNYNVINVNNRNINIATIDTILSYYLAFTYGNFKLHDTNRLLCIAKHLFEIQEQHKLSDKGLFKRFSKPCIGKPETLNDLRELKTLKFEEFVKDGKNAKNSDEFEEWFLNYKPSNNTDLNETKRETHSPSPAQSPSPSPSPKLNNTRKKRPKSRGKSKRTKPYKQYNATKKRSKYWKL
jgi:hypothetical protein